MRLFIFFIFIISLTGCSDKLELQEQSLPAAVLSKVSFSDDIRPIIETKCVACHSCFDAPCQLKLESDRGLSRGATLVGAYDATRLEATHPTRLNIDATTESGWRELGFHSILSQDDDGKALLYKMLSLGKRYSFPANKKLPSQLDISIRRDNICPLNESFPDYESHHALAGMPFAVTGLSDKEYALVIGWLQQGVEVDKAVTNLSHSETEMIAEWESSLNRSESRHQLVSRWLFEHLFLAHLYFENKGEATRYFELVRSYTPPGQAIDIVNTRLPNSDPGAEIFYRLRPIDGVIVHKRHISFRFDKQLSKEIDELFFSTPWQVKAMPDYSYEARANPFLTYMAIPSKARYQFMLNHAEYFVRTFIRGPVCRGQIATDVIRDQFWLLFQDPDKDLFITDKAYAHTVSPLLGLPGQNDHLLDLDKQWRTYKNKRNAYLKKRDSYYGQQPKLNDLNTIWNGENHNTNALLTVFRHFDNASVRRGLIGAIPETLWWMDYPLFERTYYELVVNFDVFGNVSHQLQTRLYFDLIRNGAEHNFLRLLPADKRQGVLDNWYQGLASLKSRITYSPLDTLSPTQVKYQTDAPKTELAGKLLNQFSLINATNQDPINRCERSECFRDDEPKWIQHADMALHGLTGLDFNEYKGLLFLPEMSFIRINNADGQRTVYSLIRNRYHTNVAFLLGESWRYKPKKDTLTIYPGIAGSYPNFIFDLSAEQIQAFQQQLLTVTTAEEFEQWVDRWGVRRTHPQFWQIVHDFTAWQREHEPLQAGIFDINRFENL